MEIVNYSTVSTLKREACGLYNNDACGGYPYNRGYGGYGGQYNAYYYRRRRSSKSCHRRSSGHKRPSN